MTPLRAELSSIRLEVESLYVTRDSLAYQGMFTAHDQLRYERLILRETVVVRAIAAL